MGRTSVTGPAAGGYRTFMVPFGGNAGVVDATCAYKIRVDQPCRLIGLTAGTSAAKAGSPTYDVTTTGGTVVSGRAVPDNTTEEVDISGLSAAIRDLAKGDVITVTYTDVGGATTATGFNVVFTVYTKGHVQAVASND